jgi:hypothetical protein
VRDNILFFLQSHLQKIPTGLDPMVHMNLYVCIYICVCMDMHMCLYTNIYANIFIYIICM